MMYGHVFGWGWGWMVLIPLFWISLLGVIIWAVVRLASPGGSPPEAGGGARRESAREILDRRYASGEIDADTYTQARDRLSGGVKPS